MQNAACSPAFTALGARGKFASAPTSTIQAGSPLTHTRPGSPSPGRMTMPLVSRANGEPSGQLAMHRSASPSPAQTAPASQPSDPPIAVRSRG